MEYRRLGSSGLEVSVVGLGTAGFGRRVARETAVRLVHEAVEQGINYLDTAEDVPQRVADLVLGIGFRVKDAKIAKAIRHLASTPAPVGDPR